MTAVGLGGGKLDIGRVLQGTFSVISRNFVTFLALSAIFAGLPSVIASVSVSQMMGPAGQFTNFSALPSLIPTWLVAIVANSVLQGALVHATVADMNGRPVSVPDCLATGLRHFLPLIGIGILYALGVGLGCVLLLVPGLIAAVVWCLAVPSEVVERTTVFSSFQRSRDLTRGNRWRIFGVFVIYMVIAWVIQAVLLGVFGGFGAMAMGPGRLNVVVTPIVAVINGMIGAAGIGVLYSEVRRAKDGVGAAELAAMFD